jgi:hypothetical protein
LFGQIGYWAAVSNLGVEQVDVNGTGNSVGGLVASNKGSITTSYSNGTVSGDAAVGGLVGYNWWGSSPSVADCYSTGMVSGDWHVGGLVGLNEDRITTSYSTSTVSGGDRVGGLVGTNLYYEEARGKITDSYSTGMVNGTGDYVGGLVGRNSGGSVITSFWDMETSGQDASDGGTGKMTAEMQAARTFCAWACGDELIWTIDEGNDYPRLWWENKPGEVIKPIRLSDLLLGSGTEDDPFLIYTAEELNLIGWAVCDWYKHFRLMDDLDMSGFDGKEGRPSFNIIGTIDNPFTGVFDGNGHKISYLSIEGTDYVGLFGHLGGRLTGIVRHLGILEVNITGLDSNVGGLAGSNRGGRISYCYSTGSISGEKRVGGLVGYNGSFQFGAGVRRGWITSSYSTGTVTGNKQVGGLVGENSGSVSNAYSTGTVSGDSYIGGLMGSNKGSIATSFWDIQTSSRTNMCTFLEAGWDLVNVWGIGENQTYPYLRKYSAADINQDKTVNFPDLAILAENWLAGIAP